jgi:hypothetical protein
MGKIIPSSRPQATRDQVLAWIKAAGLDLAAEKVIVVGRRGYYRDTMGKPYVNDRNIYDDAVWIITTDDMRAYNFNADPSKYQKGIATLVAGVYKLVKWMHHGKYHALQIIRDVLKRDGLLGKSTGRRGINFHYGGNMGTGSKGCQTFPPAQYWQFQGHAYELMDHYGLQELTYLLTENAP